VEARNQRTNDVGGIADCAVHLAVGLDVEQLLHRVAPSPLPGAPVLRLAITHAGLADGLALAVGPLPLRPVARLGAAPGQQLGFMHPATAGDQWTATAAELVAT
jgi:hypothetical protein